MKDIDIKLEDCWAKLNDDKDSIDYKKPTQDIVTHSFLVGYAARYIIEELINPFLSIESKIDLSIIPYVALHDYGKIHMSFLCKSPKWIEYIIEKNELSKKDTDELKSIWKITQDDDSEYRRTKNEYHHTVVGANLFYEVLSSTMDIPEVTCETFFEIINLHHGYKRGDYRRRNYPEDLGIDLSLTRKDFVKLIEKEFGSLNDCKIVNISEETKLLIRGVVIVADWVASSIGYVENNICREDMVRIIKKELIAKNFISTYSFLDKELSFHDIFDFDKINGLQKCVSTIPVTINDKGAVFIIEDETGQGKTEAALLLVYRILKLKLANGFYFALPTQVTSNNLYERLNSFISNIYKKWPGQNKIKLIHSMSFLREENELFSREIKNRFYNRNKVSLSYPFGIGTIDQMLLSIINTKHADLRFYGLANKIIIIDELHSYSIFTSTLLKEAISRLRKLGCIIIILSATLTKEAKEELLDVKITNVQYPSILKVRA